MQSANRTPDASGKLFVTILRMFQLTFQRTAFHTMSSLMRSYAITAVWTSGVIWNSCRDLFRRGAGLSH
jgi:hypothetical protein